MSIPSLFLRRPSAVCLAGVLLVLAATCRAADAGAHEDPPRRWWASLQLGLISALDRPDLMTDSGSARLLYGVEGGVRMTQDWKLGVLLDAGSLGKTPCPTGELSLCSSRKQDIAHQYLTVVLNPGRGSWLYQLAAGRVTYDLMQDSFFWGGHTSFEDTSGWGVRLGVGYDWHRPGARKRLGWRANLDRANPGSLPDGLGSTAHTTISLTASVNWY